MTAANIRQAIASITVSQADRDSADRLVAELRGRVRPSLYCLLAAAGLEGIKPADSKRAMLTRLHNRMTAAIRARERNEV